MEGCVPMDRAIIFDMDGTLFQTNLILEPALEATFEQLRNKGLWSGETPIDTYREIMGVPLPVVWETLCPAHSDVVREESNQLFQMALIEQIQNDRGALYEGVESTLADLAKDFPMYIASNGQTAYLEAIMEHYTLNRWIKDMYSIDLVESGDKSELVSLVMKENGVKRGSVVGDRSSYIKAASDNNLLSIGVRFDFSQEAELIHADYILDSFSNIQDVLIKTSISQK